MVDFNGFDKGVIGKPLPAVDNSKCNRCPLMQAAKKVRCENGN